MSLSLEDRNRLIPVNISDTESLAAIETDWKDLYDRSSCSNPFISYPWVKNWWKIFGGRRDPFRHKLNIITFRDPTNHLRAVVPMVLDSLGYIRKLRMAGVTKGHYLTEMHGFVVEPNYEDEFNTAFLNEIQRQRARVHWIDIDGVVAKTKLSDCLHSQLGTPGWTYKPGSEFFILPIEGGFDNILHLASRNLRGRLNNSRKQLEGHEVEFAIVDKPQDIIGAVNTFVDLHTQRANLTYVKRPLPTLDISQPTQNESSVRRHPNYLPTESHRLFIQQVCQELSQEGKAMIAQLRVDGEVQASLVLWRAGSHLYRYYSGFNPEWWGSRVMLYLNAATVNAATEMPGIKFLNLSTGRADEKIGWRPKVYQLEYFRADSTDPGKKVTNMIYQLAKRGVSRIRQSTTRFVSFL